MLSRKRELAEASKGELAVDREGDIVEPSELDAEPNGSRAFAAARERVGRHRAAVVVALVALVALLLATPKVNASTGPVVPPGVTQPKPPGTPGTTVAGVSCDPGVHQIPWSAYSPICIPAWHGDNGGATAPGVTSKTVTISVRNVISADLQLIYSILPATVVGTPEQGNATVNSYVRLFNKYFDLYGRKVVIKYYDPQGNWLLEDTGAGQAQAEGDAVNVADTLHAFADFSAYSSSELYTAALQQQGVAAFGLYLLSSAYYRQNAPYQYVVGPNCNKAGAGLAALLGKEMAGSPAIYAGDPALRAKTRVFGVITPQGPGTQACSTFLANKMQANGTPFASQQLYIFNINQLQSTLSTAVAALKAAGVTTVVLSGADAVSPSYVLQVADAQNYHPEWVLENLFAGTYGAADGFVRNFVHGAPDQANSMLQIGTAPVPPSQQETIRAYKEANHGSTANMSPGSRDLIYASLLELFDLLQAAGPDLTLPHLHQAMADTTALPSVSTGELGGWAWGPGTVDPASNYQLLKYSPTTTSFLDGGQGAMVPCTALYSYAKGGADVPRHEQPACPS